MAAVAMPTEVYPRGAVRQRSRLWPDDTRYITRRSGQRLGEFDHEHGMQTMFQTVRCADHLH